MAKVTKEKVTSCLKGSALTLATLAGVIGGVVFGLCLRTREEKWTEREVMYVSYVGKLFLRMLKALILPLIIPSLVAAVGALDMSISGKVGGRALLITCPPPFWQLFWASFSSLLFILGNPELKEMSQQRLENLEM